MRVIAWLCCIVTHVWTVNANVEKTIFSGPHPVAFPNDHPDLDTLRLDALSPAHKPVLEARLPVQFPSASAPRGVESWYLLRGLEEGRRYEVRICWPATSPTDFWLDTYPIQQVFDTPELISSLSKYSEQRQDRVLGDSAHLSGGAATSVLLLRIQAAASFYSRNRTLMEYPLDVDTDIILDPFILNLLPRSLAPIGAYISVVAVGAWFLSGFVYRYIVSVVNEPLPKPHTD